MIKDFLLNKFSIVAALIGLFSLFIYNSYSLFPMDWGVFAIFSVITYVFWTQMGVIAKLLPKVPRILFTLFISFIWVLLFISSYFFFDEYKEFLPLGVV